MMGRSFLQENDGSFSRIKEPDDLCTPSSLPPNVGRYAASRKLKKKGRTTGH